VISKLKRILKGFTSLAAQRVFFDDANNATCKSNVGFNGLPYSVIVVSNNLLVTLVTQKFVNNGLADKTSTEPGLRTPWHFRGAGSRADYFRLRLRVRTYEAHEYKRAIQLCNTDFYWTLVTSSYCVLHRRLAINTSKKSLYEVW